MSKSSTMGGSIQWNLTLGRREAEIVQALANAQYDGNRSQAVRALVRIAEPFLDKKIVSAKTEVIGGKKYAWRD